MSADAVGYVYRHSPYTGVVFQVHGAVADSVNDQNGNEFWLTKPKLATKARTSVASAKRAMETLVLDGFLSLMTESKGRGPSRYVFLFPDVPVVYESRSTGSPRAGSDSQPAHQENPTGSPGTENGAHKERSQREPNSSKRQSFPDGFFITAEMRAWAAREAPGVDLRFQTQQFADHWRGKGEKRADWVATWRTWIRNARQWSRSTPAAEPVAVVADFVAPPDPNDFDAWMDEHDPGWRERIPQS